jgi:hypothetical protein
MRPTTFIHTAVLAILASTLTPKTFAADSRPHYEMRSVSTEIWNRDADYYAPPIVLHRNKNTYDIHRIEFEAARYVEECVYWQQVCVAWAPNGQCIRWETQCARWDYRAYPVKKQIQIDFRSLPDPVGDQEETYELTITRSRPGTSGEDWVTTWLKDEKTLVPVKIMHWSDWDYRVSLK